MRTWLWLIIVLAMAGYLVWSSDQPADRITPPPSDWKETVNTAGDIRYSYPPQISGHDYITATNWPPAVTVVQNSDCAGEKKVVEDREYCVVTQSEGAAGSTYTTYSYRTGLEGKFLSIQFTLRYLQCANFVEAKKAECEAEQKDFQVDKMISGIAKTIKINN